MPEKTILVINTGSSSLKFGVYAGQDGDEQLRMEGSADGIGREHGKLVLKDATGKSLRSEDLQVASEAEALDHAARWLSEAGQGEPTAIGHRVVHGGPHLVTHQIITPELLEQLRGCVHFAPLHIPTALELIEKAERAYPGIPQFACFDTAFHQTMPEVATRFPLPRDLFDEGIRRYGFHGLSYESIVHGLGADLRSRTVVAHLGSGASLAALADGRSVDTSMGLTPTGGIPMATRSGDLDPGVLLYLLRVKGMGVDDLEKLLNRSSGLGAVSGVGGDMRDIEAAAGTGNGQAQLALDLFTNAIRKTVAAYASELGGLEMLVFSGGIGEHSARVRADVCRGLGLLGVGLEASLNDAHAVTISGARSRVEVRIVPSQEDLQIARHCRAMMQAR